MYPKAYRWVAEMEEIAGFIGAPDAGGTVLDGAARFYERIAADAEGEQRDTGALSAFYRDTK
jgi:hypothetical protein